MDIPIIVKIFVSLITILTVNRLTKNLPLAILSATLLLAVWSGHSALAIADIAWERFFSLDNGLLILIITLVIWLSTLMDKTEMMRDLVANIRYRLSPRTAMAVLPAVIGLLPMPGGALFSAPLVGDVDEKNELPPLEKTRVNYWFRHIWEFTWPLYPGVILASDISGLDIWQIVIVGLPMVFLYILAGYIFILRKIELSPVERVASEHHILKLVSPILIVIITYAGVTIFFPELHNLSKYFPMALGLALAIIALGFQRPVSRREWKEVILNKKAFNMVIIIVIVRIYGAFIEARLPGGTLLMEQMRQELELFGIPIFLLMMIIPFISGFTTGVSVGFVGASFPIVFSLLGADPTMWQLLAGFAMGYGFGFSGTMLSPVHVCLVVTNEHFGSRLGESMVSLIPPILFFMGAALVISRFLL
ncbi:MAG: DUF401 family protein [Spirochaetaceae bacterium]